MALALRRGPRSPAGGIDGDPLSAQLPFGVTKRTAAFVATGVAAYLAALAWTIPASAVMSPTPGIGAIGGTVWRGHATLIDGSRAEWRWAPLRSLTGLGFAADWTIAGSGNDLAGVAVIGMNTTTIEAASGTASGAVLAAALPYLHFTCAMPLQVNIKRIRIGGGSQGAEGEVNAGSGLCAPRGGGAATLTPSMVLSLTRVGSDSRILLVPAGQRRRTLAEGSLSEDGKLQLRVTPEGSQVLPFAAPAGGIGIETSF